MGATGRYRPATAVARAAAAYLIVSREGPRLFTIAHSVDRGSDVTAFRALLVVMLVVLAGYTAIVISSHGWGLLSVFFGDMAKMTWPGQFNLDFLFMLTLSASWVAWRHRFSTGGLALGVLALFGGALFLTIYLLIVSRQVHGDPRALLLGRAGGASST